MRALDDRRVGKAHRDVVAAGTELLEVARLAGHDERLDRLGAVERVGLQPFLALGEAVAARRGHHLVQAGVHVGDDGVTRKRRQRHAVRFVLRAGHDHADRSFVMFCEIGHASFPVTGSIRPGQGVGHGRARHVVGDLADRVAEPAGLVEQHDVEAAEARFVGRQHVDAAAGVGLAVQRVVVLEDEHRDLRRMDRRRHHEDVDAGRVVGDLRAAHRVADVVRRIDDQWIDTVRGQDGDVVALAVGKVEMHLSRIDRPSSGPPDGSHRCRRRTRRASRPGLASGPDSHEMAAGAALRHHRHVTGVEVDRDVLDRRGVRWSSRAPDRCRPCGLPR